MKDPRPGGDRGNRDRGERLNGKFCLIWLLQSATKPSAVGGKQCQAQSGTSSRLAPVWGVFLHENINFAFRGVGIRVTAYRNCSLTYSPQGITTVETPVACRGTLFYLILIS